MPCRDLHVIGELAGGRSYETFPSSPLPEVTVGNTPVVDSQPQAAQSTAQLEETQVTEAAGATGAEDKVSD